MGYGHGWRRCTSITRRIGTHPYPKDKLKDREDGSVSAIRELMPGSDEPAYYVKIKEGMYLVSITEQNMEKILQWQRSSAAMRCVLDNWNRMYGVGRGFGTMTTDV